MVTGPQYSLDHRVQGSRRRLPDREAAETSDRSLEELFRLYSINGALHHDLPVAGPFTRSSWTTIITADMAIDAISLYWHCLELRGSNALQEQESSRPIRARSLPCR